VLAPPPVPAPPLFPGLPLSLSEQPNDSALTKLETKTKLKKRRFIVYVPSKG
jgi:hypothetical protein